MKTTIKKISFHELPGLAQQVLKGHENKGFFSYRPDKPYLPEGSISRDDWNKKSREEKQRILTRKLK